jgi:cell division cycle protein 20 (cofactor of APC complex)
LDAPGLVDDFYLDLLDFGSNNHLLVALMDRVYLWNPDNEVTLLTTLQDSYVASVRWLDSV